MINLRAVFIILFFALFTTKALAAQEQNYQVLVKGRVVDEQGKPVPKAHLMLRPPAAIDTWADCIIESYEADDEGRFQIKRESSLGTEERVLYVMTPSPKNTIPLVWDSPFNRSLSKAEPRFAGQKIFIKKNQEVDLGQISVQVKWAEAFLSFRDQTGSLMTGKEDLQNAWIRVRDKRGDVISEQSLPFKFSGVKTLKVAIQFEDNAIAVCLPEGLWELEIFLGDKIAIEPALNIQTANLPIRTTLQFLPQTNQVKEDTSPSKDAGEARRELEKLGIEYSEESFFERSESGNLKAVKLFLAAGIHPDTRGAYGVTPLMEAVHRSSFEMAQTLIHHGADVNARDSKGVTALMIALFVPETEPRVVDLLLKNGADVNAKTDDGRTPLMFAAMNQYADNARLLIAAGADATARDDEGKTALMWAQEMSNDAFIDLLKKSQAKKK